MNPVLERLPIPLLAWYETEKRPLPWRETTDPYKVWVSEIMLQQTRAAAVLDYYKRFLEQFPDILSLANAPEDALLKAWQGLGYYSRVRNMRKAAKVIVSEYSGVFPNEYAEIRGLPGIGDYTAGAVSSISFGRPRAAVDGNVLRVVSRLTANPANVDIPQTKREVTQELEAVIPARVPGLFNQAMMELGATVCLPNGPPGCEKCPVKSLCLAYSRGRQREFPVRSPKRPRRVERRRVYLIFQDGQVAVHKRESRGLLAGLWEFPNFSEENDPYAPAGLAFVGTGKHIFTHIQWEMTAFTGDFEQILGILARNPGDSERISEENAWVWATADDLRDTYSIPSAFRPFLSIALEKLREKEEI